MNGAQPSLINGVTKFISTMILTLMLWYLNLINQQLEAMNTRINESLKLYYQLRTETSVLKTEVETIKRQLEAHR